MESYMSKIVVAVIFISFSAFAGEECDAVKEYLIKIEGTVNKFTTSFEGESGAGASKSDKDFLEGELKSLRDSIKLNDESHCQMKLASFKIVWKAIKDKYFGG